MGKSAERFLNPLTDIVARALTRGVHTNTFDLKATSVANPALLTKAQLAGELQCSPRHVERLQRERKIPVIRLSTRCVRYSRERVLSALARGCEQEAIA